MHDYYSLEKGTD